MSRITKRKKLVNEKVELGKQYQVMEAIDLLKSIPTVKFKESIDISVNLGIDPSKSDQNVRSAVLLPNGTGRAVRVAVFADGDALAIAAHRRRKPDAGARAQAHLADNRSVGRDPIGVVVVFHLVAVEFIFHGFLPAVAVGGDRSRRRGALSCRPWRRTKIGT